MTDPSDEQHETQRYKYCDRQLKLPLKREPLTAHNFVHRQRSRDKQIQSADFATILHLNITPRMMTVAAYMP